MTKVWINGALVAVGLMIGLGVSEINGNSEAPAAMSPTSLKNMSPDIWKSVCVNANPYRALSDIERYDVRAAMLTRIDVRPITIKPTVIADRGILCKVEVEMLFVGEDGPVQKRTGVQEIWLIDAFSNTASVVDAETAKWIANSPVVASLATWPKPNQEQASK